MSESEIARLRKQMELTHEASMWALSGLQSGTAQHAFITARMRRMDTSYHRLRELIGEEQATDVLCEVFDGKKQEKEDGLQEEGFTHPSRSEAEVLMDAHPGGGSQKHSASLAPPLLPVHWSEVNPLDLRHYVLRLLLHDHYTAPLSPFTQRILDVGCGTGLWAREMAQQFPQAQVIGLDLDLSHISASWPANCQFVEGDVLVGLPFADDSFDFVHQCCLAGQLSTPTWPMVIRELIRVTRPGGWIELVELGQRVANPGPATTRYLRWWGEWSERTGIYTTVVEHLDDLLQYAGLGQVAQRCIIAPVGQWGKQAGTLLMTDMIETMQMMQRWFCRTLRLSPTLFTATLEALPAEWEKHQTTFHFFLTYGQKKPHSP